MGVSRSGYEAWKRSPVSDRSLADGPSILSYLRTVAEEYGVDELIRYRHKVKRASWDSGTALWTGVRFTRALSEFLRESYGES